MTDLPKLQAQLPFPSPCPEARWPRALVAALGGICALLGLVVLTGWLFHSVTAIQLRPTLAPMQFNTALCVLLAGLALVFWASRRAPRTVAFLGGLVAAFGGLTLCEYLFRTHLGIDQLFFHCYITTETSNPGRMSPVSAFCFLLAGLALLSLVLGAPTRWRPALTGTFASIIVSVTLVALLGYAFGLPGTYGWAQLTRIAIHTAAGLSLLGAGLFIAAWSIALNPGERTPRWLPLPLTLAVITGSLVLCFALESKQDKDIAQTVRAGAEGAKNQIAVRMESRLRSLVRMARDWELSSAPAQAAWEANAASYVHDLPDVQAVELIDAGRHIRWNVPVPGNGDRLSALALDERCQAAMDQATREGKPVITRAVSLSNGEPGFLAYVPVVLEGRPGGFLAAVFKAQTCLQRYLPPAVADGEAITVSDGSQLLFERGAAAYSTRDDWTVEEKIKLDGATWNLRMHPTPELARRIDSSLPMVALCAGILSALLLGAVAFYAQHYSRQAAETARANTALRAALEQVKTLEGLLPVCCYCKRVRDDTGYWSQIDTYLRRHTKVAVSHGYCPECAVKFYEECGIEVPENVKAELAAGNFE